MPILSLIVDESKQYEHLIAWYEANARDLPWRAPGTTAWGVLLSEVMSHQTQVDRVAPIWQEWIARWPTPHAFAQAGADEVLRAWGNLGYPRRALRLLECARVIVDKHGGDVPADVDALLALPGIGDYTAGAVANFAYGRDVPVVDTNVRRVHARAVRGEATAKPSKRELTEIPHGPQLSVALMELGALVCTARDPRCGECPVVDCAWLAAGKPPAVEKPRSQRFAGTDRQVRGKIMRLLRESTEPVEQSLIDATWHHPAQTHRALFSLLDDGLAVQDEDGRFRLPR
ncbi:A/G-specific adenine glycosylase [Corynebacterium hadale]|uniref:Adenine DNA glycosylase n=1 Tax=Corynebacterium hadale TaxID=2026255 RepID=A0A269PBS1_9CORY|nr:adenine glycosylase [Corynebacterium hadale]WKC60934.1 A/G-specific adenine glycosylase [Corynebacterium hadale]